MSSNSQGLFHSWKACSLPCQLLGMWRQILNPSQSSHSLQCPLPSKTIGSELVFLAIKYDYNWWFWNKIVLLACYEQIYILCLHVVVISIVTHSRVVIKHHCWPRFRENLFQEIRDYRVLCFPLSFLSFSPIFMSHFGHRFLQEPSSVCQDQVKNDCCHPHGTFYLCITALLTTRILCLLAWLLN